MRLSRGGSGKCVSDSGRIVAEDSDASGYLDRQMGKTESDLKNALRRKPSARDIFLLSGERKRLRLRRSSKAQSERGREMEGGKDLHLWGAEEIATQLIEKVFSDTVIRRLGSAGSPHICPNCSGSGTKRRSAGPRA